MGRKCNPAHAGFGMVQLKFIVYKQWISKKNQISLCIDNKSNEIKGEFSVTFAAVFVSCIEENNVLLQPL